MSLPKESLRKRVTDFFKTFKIVDFRRDFCHQRSFAVLLGRVVVTILYIFQCSFLFNEFSDDKSDCSMLEYRWRIFEFEVGERFLASENERLTVYLSVIIVQFICFELYQMRKVGAVTFDKRVVCPFMFNNLSELKSGKECDGFTLISGADFRRDDRLFYWLLL